MRPELKRILFALTASTVLAVCPPLYAQESPSSPAKVTVVTDLELQFINAVENDRVDVVTDLLKKGVSPNRLCRQDEPALVRALRMSSNRVARVLIDAKGINLDAETDFGENALMLAAFAGNLDLVKELVDKGASVNKMVGWTALQYAATQGYNDIVVYLLERGANVNTRTENGITALYMAARKPSREVVMTLLRAGAYRDLCNERGESPAKAARQAGDTKLADFLEIDRCVEPRPGIVIKKSTPEVTQ